MGVEIDGRGARSAWHDASPDHYHRQDSGHSGHYQNHFDDMRSLQEGMWTKAQSPPSAGTSRPSNSTRKPSYGIDQDRIDTRFSIPGPVDVIDLGSSLDDSSSYKQASGSRPVRSAYTPDTRLSTERLGQPQDTRDIGLPSNFLHQLHSGSPQSPASADSFGEYVIPSAEDVDQLAGYRETDWATETPLSFARPDAEAKGTGGQSNFTQLKKLVSTKGSALAGSLLRRTSSDGRGVSDHRTTNYLTSEDEKKNIEPSIAKERYTLPSSIQRQMPPPLLLGRTVQETVLISDHAARLRSTLPPRLRLSDQWSLVYSLSQHGATLSTLYRLLDNCAFDASEAGAGFLVAIQDSRNEVFGAYANEILRPQKGYYGNGECFLWKAEQNDVKPDVTTYRWTGLNDYLILTEMSFVSFGGGDGKFGLWIDQNLEHGVSSRCPCFENDILAGGKSGRFTCVGFEIWAIGM